MRVQIRENLHVDFLHSLKDRTEKDFLSTLRETSFCCGRIDPKRTGIGRNDLLPTITYYHSDKFDKFGNANQKFDNNRILNMNPIIELKLFYRFL